MILYCTKKKIKGDCKNNNIDFKKIKFSFNDNKGRKKKVFSIERESKLFCNEKDGEKFCLTKNKNRRNKLQRIDVTHTQRNKCNCFFKKIFK